MATDDIINTFVYKCNGATTRFPVPCRFFDSSEIVVTGVDPDGESVVVTYSVEGGEGKTGNVVTSTVLAKESVITIQRVLPYSQPQEFDVLTSSTTAQANNKSLDRLMMQAQQVRDNLVRALTLPLAYYEAGIDMTLPAPDAGKALLYNEDANGIVNSTYRLDEQMSGSNIYSAQVQEDLVAAQASVTITETAASSASSSAISATSSKVTAENAAASVAGVLPHLSGANPTDLLRVKSAENGYEFISRNSFLDPVSAANGKIMYRSSTDWINVPTNLGQTARLLHVEAGIPVFKNPVFANISQAGPIRLASVQNVYDGSPFFSQGITPAALFGALGISSIADFTLSYAFQPITLGDDIDTLHVLGKTPKIVHLWLVNGVTDLEYSPGDQVLLVSGGAGGPGATQYLTMTATSTNVRVIFNSEPPKIISKINGNQQNIDVTKWGLRYVLFG